MPQAPYGVGDLLQLTHSLEARRLQCMTGERGAVRHQRCAHSCLRGVRLRPGRVCARAGDGQPPVHQLCIAVCVPPSWSQLEEVSAPTGV